MASESKPGVTGSSIIDFKLPATDGKTYTPADFEDKEILVLIFMCNHCPYVKAVMDRLVTIQDKFTSKNVQLVGINPNDEITYPEDSFDNMKTFVDEYGMNFPYLRDESQEVARAYDAVCTPDIYVYDRSRKLRYRGRIDDNWKDDKAVTSNDLEEALSSLLEHKEIEFRQVPSIGCSIKWKSS